MLKVVGLMVAAIAKRQKLAGKRRDLTIKFNLKSKRKAGPGFRLCLSLLQ
jgi:hypothetical protein